MRRRYSLVRSDNYPITGRTSYSCSGSGTMLVYTGFRPKSAIVALSTIPSSGSGYLPGKFTGSQDCTSVAMDELIGGDIAMYSTQSKWRVDYIRLLFSTAASRTYSVKIKNGRRIVSDLNDTFYFQINDGSDPQLMTLDEGFYTGTEMASHLATKMDANAVYSGAGYTFSVTYNTGSGLFTIVPTAGGNMGRYIDEGSTAGYVYGFSSTTSYGASLVSDTVNLRLDQELVALSGAASTTLEHYNDDVRIMEFDQLLRIESSVAPLTLNYEVSYDYEGVLSDGLPRIYVSGYQENGFNVAYENIPADIGFIEFSYMTM